MKQSNNIVKVSAPCKVHLLGEHAVVYGKPALLTTVDLRVTATIIPSTDSRFHLRGVGTNDLKKIIEPFVKKHLKIKSLPPYKVEIHSEVPIGSGLGSSAAISASYIAALLSFLKINWDLELVNKLTSKTEKVFHGNPSGADPATVIFGGLIWFRKETPDLKIIKQLEFSIPQKLAKNFVLINTGKPKETTKDMVEMVSSKFKVQNSKFKELFDDQERLVKELVAVLKAGDEKGLIRIIREGERNLESIGACSAYVKKIIRQIEDIGGAAKICGGGGATKEVGVLLAYHPNKKKLLEAVKPYNLPYFTTTLGVEGLKKEV